MESSGKRGDMSVFGQFVSPGYSVDHVLRRGSYRHVYDDVQIKLGVPRVRDHVIWKAGRCGRGPYLGLPVRPGHLQRDLFLPACAASFPRLMSKSVRITAICFITSMFSCVPLHQKGFATRLQTPMGPPVCSDTHYPNSPSVVHVLFVPTSL